MMENQAKSGMNAVRPIAVKWMFLLLGFVSLGLGILGIFLPLLPTTPFLLLAAACFLRSSERMHTWLLHNRWFGGHLRDYSERRTISGRVRAGTLIILWSAITVSFIWATSEVWLRILLIAVGLAVTIHVISLKINRQAS